MINLTWPRKNLSWHNITRVKPVKNLLIFFLILFHTLIFFLKKWFYMNYNIVIL